MDHLVDVTVEGHIVQVWAWHAFLHMSMYVYVALGGPYTKICFLWPFNRTENIFLGILDTLIDQCRRFPLSATLGSRSAPPCRRSVAGNCGWLALVKWRCTPHLRVSRCTRWPHFFFSLNFSWGVICWYFDSRYLNRESSCFWWIYRCKQWKWDT